jgi:hypothetical protein
MKTTKQDLLVASSNGSRAFSLKEATHQTMARRSLMRLEEPTEPKLSKTRKNLLKNKKKAKR